MNLQQLKIIIVEDYTLELCAIRQGLLKLGRNGSDRIQDGNITSLKINSHDDLENLIIKIKEISPDILFLDLHLVEDINDGVGIINQLLEDSSELKYLPKYIISGVNKVLNNHSLNDTFQYAYHMTKPEVKTLRGGQQEQCDQLAIEYNKLFDATHKLTDTLPVVASMYRAIKKKFELSESFENILYKIDNLEIKNDQTISILKSQSKILDKITINTADIKQKTELIEIITMATAKALPKITDKDKARKLLNDWRDNKELEKVFEDDFPTLPKGLITTLEQVIENISDETINLPIKDISQMIYDEAKKFILSELDKRAEVSKEDTQLMVLTKYGGLLINTILKVLGLKEK